jgi:hypothetical protein
MFVYRNVTGYSLIISMNPIDDELDPHRKTFGQVEPTPEPALDNPEEPNGDGKEAGNEESCLIFYFFI